MLSSSNQQNKRSLHKAESGEIDDNFFYNLKFMRKNEDSISRASSKQKEFNNIVNVKNFLSEAVNNKQPDKVGLDNNFLGFQSNENSLIQPKSKLSNNNNTNNNQGLINQNKRVTANPAIHNKIH